VSIKSVVADVCDRVLHPLDLYCTGCRVKIVIQKLLFPWRLFPIEVVGHLAPEAGRVVNGSRVHRAILIHAHTMSLTTNVFRWTIDATADGFGRRIYVRHFRIKTTNRRKRSPICKVNTRDNKRPHPHTHGCQCYLAEKYHTKRILLPNEAKNAIQIMPFMMKPVVQVTRNGNLILSPLNQVIADNCTA